MKKKFEDLKKPEPSIEEAVLSEAGFINSGKVKFRQMVKAFSDELFRRSIYIYDAGSGADEREITQEHVATANHQIYGSPSRSISYVALFLQLAEYFASAGVGAGASNLDKNWGIIILALSSIILVVCFVSRTVLLRD